MTRRLALLTGLLAFTACGDIPTDVTGPDAPAMSGAATFAGSLANTTISYVSGTHVQAYPPILPASADGNWPNSICGGMFNTSNPPAPAYGPNDPAWGTTTHNAFVPTTNDGVPGTHPWAGIVGTPWINAWNDLASVGPGGQNWTRYDMPVQGNGTFELKLIADNCSWIYIDGVLTGFQPVGGEQVGQRRTYGVTLNGSHTLTFIIFDGGGAAGGNFSLTTTTNPPPPLNPDLDADGHLNDDDAFPLDPTEWADSDGDGVGDNTDAFPNDPNETTDTDGDGVGDNADVEPTRTNHYAWVDWQSVDVNGGTATGVITLAGGTQVTVNLRVADPAGPAPLFGYTNNGSNVGGIAGFPYHNWFSSTPSTYTSAYVLNHPGFDDDIIGLAGGAESGHPLSSYIITFSPAVSDPAMAIMSLGAGGNPSTYDFDRTFEIVSQGGGRFGGGSASLVAGAGETLTGNEGNGTIRFLGSFSTFSWSVPDGEVWHGFTIGVRGLADPTFDSDGDGVPDATDNCPAVPNADQGDSDGDAVGNACDLIDDGNADSDGDGLTNAQEHQIGTSPTNPDTDGDGVNDGSDGCPLDPTCTSLDNTPPSIVANVTGTLNGDWYTSDVSVSWTVTDDESDVESTDGCGTVGVTEDTDGVTFTCTATSAGGTASASVTIQRDASPPVVTAHVAGTEGDNGWYTSDIAVSWTVSEPTSPLTSAGCTPSDVTADTGETSFTCTATSAGGTTTETVTVKRDATDPSIVFSGNTAYTVDQTVAITCSATDAMSGIASSDCPGASGDAYAFAVGTHTLQAEATDNAGNASSASTSFTVSVDQGSLCALVQRWVSNKGVANSMCQQLKNRAYGAFINHVEAQAGKKFLAADKGAILIALARQL